MFVSKIRRIMKRRTRKVRKANVAVRKTWTGKIASKNQRNGGHCLKRKETGLLRYLKSANRKNLRLVVKRPTPFPVFKRRNVMEKMKL
jgi:hypothetical protein